MPKNKGKQLSLTEQVAVSNEKALPSINNVKVFSLGQNDAGARSLSQVPLAEFPTLHVQLAFRRMHTAGREPHCSHGAEGFWGAAVEHFQSVHARLHVYLKYFLVAAHKSFNCKTQPRKAYRQENRLTRNRCEE